MQTYFAINLSNAIDLSSLICIQAWGAYTDEVYQHPTSRFIAVSSLFVGYLFRVGAGKAHGYHATQGKNYKF